MKLFGKELFGFKKEPETMYDFAQHGLLSHDVITGPAFFDSNMSIQTSSVKIAKKKEVKKIYITPKGIYEMKSLNAHNFTINTDTAYLTEQTEDIKAKLELMGKEKKPKKNSFSEPMTTVGGVKYGRLELMSIWERLENRKKIDGFENILEKYPHTTSELIDGVVEGDSNLRCQKADEFIPDFPREAINAMKEYNDACIKLCNKKSVFYVVASKKDFEQKNRRRDPILLAQSPFGFFWQILGAWDREMVLLADL